MPGVYHGSARWQDFDNDGSLDFLLCGATGNPYNEQPVTKVFRNDGSGSFTQVADLVGVYYGEAVWCDINNDGFPDIIESGSSGNELNRDITTNVYKNQGDGTFLQLSGHMLPPATGSSLGCGDYDNDGYMDILMIGSLDTNFYIPETKLYRNNGDDTFTPENDLAFPGLGYGDVAWADYDQDGFLDVLVAGANAYGGRNCMVYRSTGGTTPNTAPGGPENLQANSDGDLIVFSWEEAFDEITPQPCLTYNLRIGTTPGGCEIMAPLSQPGGQTLNTRSQETWARKMNFPSNFHQALIIGQYKLLTMAGWEVRLSLISLLLLFLSQQKHGFRSVRILWLII
ncbi:MAG: VCBS repeat-containing protein [Bacteroidales bacterium]|nr:VCBS repeat-containing protein [Bacteroidales bacterium]